MVDPAASDGSVDVDALVAELAARVAARREAGEYPPDLDQMLSGHFQRILDMRRGGRPAFDLQGPLAAVRGSLPLDRQKIPVDSGVPGGELVHQAVAKAVGRQIEGVLQQVQAFAQSTSDLLASLVATVETLDVSLAEDVNARIDSLIDRQAAQERLLSGIRGRAVPVGPGAGGPAPSLAELLEGRDPRLVLSERTGLDPLKAADRAALDGLGIRGWPGTGEAIELDGLLTLAADRLAPGGLLVVEITGRDGGVHPAQLSFLLTETGFTDVELRWRDHAGPGPAPEERLLHPPEYLVVATR